MKATTMAVVVLAACGLVAGCPGTRYKLGPDGPDITTSGDVLSERSEDASPHTADNAAESRNTVQDIAVANETWADEDLIFIDEYVGPTCPPEAPFLRDDGDCVECLANNHCINQMECDPDTYTCGPPAVCELCEVPYPQCAFVLDELWACVGCLSDEDCGPNGHCNVETYSCTGIAPAECETCQPPYPACAQFNETWSCVQCTDDTYCANGGWCDLDLYICNGSDQPGCSGCTEDSQCEDLQGQLLCDGPTGCCFNQDGWCDGMAAHCHYQAGSECVAVGGPPGVPAELSLCNCTQPITLEQLEECVDTGLCPPGEECLGDLVCMGGTMMTIIPGGEDTGPFCISPALLALLAQ